MVKLQVVFAPLEACNKETPLSPLLFVLAQQVLSTNLKKCIDQLSLIPYKVGRNQISLSHLFYADDILLFTNGVNNSLRSLMQLLQSYELSSGQRINRSKSAFYIHNKYQRREPMIASATGLRRNNFPFIYLGLPIFYGRPKSVYYEPLVDKVRAALEGWKSKLLSFGGRITVIKSVLSTFPIYTIASAAVPKSILKRIESFMARFLWGVKGETRTHWINWKSVCTPLDEGGLGIRSLNQMQDGLHAKLMWVALLDSSLWARVIRAKYFVGGRPVIPHNASMALCCNVCGLSTSVLSLVSRKGRHKLLA